MKNKAPKTSKDVLLTLLRKKQQKIGFSYITTKSTSYGIFRWLFFAAVIYCTLINLFYILGKSGELAANLANMGTPEPHQEIEIARINATIYIMIGAAIGLFLSEVFVWFKLPVFQFVFSLAPSITIIARLSSEINDPTSNILASNHIIPLSFLCFFAAVSSGLLFNQLYRDKKACEEINTIIYNTYKVLPEELPTDEWDNVLEAYEPRVIKKKDKSKKKRKDKKVDLDITPNQAEQSIDIATEETKQPQE